MQVCKHFDETSNSNSYLMSMLMYLYSLQCQRWGHTIKISLYSCSYFCCSFRTKVSRHKFIKKITEAWQYGNLINLTTKEKKKTNRLKTLVLTRINLYKSIKLINLPNRINLYKSMKLINLANRTIQLIIDSCEYQYF